MNKEELIDVYTTAITANPELAPKIKTIYKDTDLNDDVKIKAIQALAKSSATTTPKTKDAKPDTDTRPKVWFKEENGNLVIKGATSIKRSFGTIMKNDYEGSPIVFAGASLPIDAELDGSTFTIRKTIKDLTKSEIEDIKKFLATLNTKAKGKTKDEKQDAKGQSKVEQAKILIERGYAPDMEKALEMVG